MHLREEIRQVVCSENIKTDFSFMKDLYQLLQMHCKVVKHLGENNSK